MYDQKKPPTSERTLPVLGRSGIEPLLDSHTAAAMLNVHPRTLQRMVLRGLIAGVQVGKLWRFRASVLNSCLILVTLIILPYISTTVSFRYCQILS